MRKDMGRVIIESARQNSSAPSRKARSFGKIVMTEDGPEYFGETKLPMNMNGRAHGWDSKNFTDVLGPFKKFLRSSVGRHWDDVYSDIASILGSAGWGVRHILTQHLDVETNTFLNECGRVRYISKYGSRIDYPRDGDLYVDPVNRTLCMAGQSKFWKTYGQERYKDPRPIEYALVTVSKTEEYRWIKGVWYFMRWDKKSERVYRGQHERFGFPIYEWIEQTTLVLKKQLSKKELRSFYAARHKVQIVRREWTEEEKKNRYGKRLVRL